MKKDKLYNVLFPIWLLWVIPVTWIVVLPGNFLIDLLVVVLTMKHLKIENIKQEAKKVILRVWIFGFIADFIGTVGMIIPEFIIFRNTPIENWWYHNISNAVMYNPFNSIYSIIWVTVCLIIAVICIYLFNYKFCLNKSTLDEIQKKKVALSLAIFTAPYLFYFPSMILYN